MQHAFIIKEDKETEAAFKALSSTQLFIAELGDEGWQTFWDGSELRTGGKHYICRKFKDHRIVWAQSVVRPFRLSFCSPGSFPPATRGKNFTRFLDSSLPEFQALIPYPVLDPLASTRRSNGATPT